MRLPDDWDTDRASGWWEHHYLIHTPCGWRSHNAYDLILKGGAYDAVAAREVVYGHRCSPDECST